MSYTSSKIELSNSAKTWIWPNAYIHAFSGTCKRANLGHGVELNHGIGEGVSIRPEVGHQAEHGAVERAVDLGERSRTRVVHVDHRDVAQESTRREVIVIKSPRWVQAVEVLYSCKVCTTMSTYIQYAPYSALSMAAMNT